MIELCVTAPGELAALSRPPWARDVGAIALHISGEIETAKGQRLVTAINRELRACGCFTASGFCLAALASLPVIATLSPASLPAGWMASAGLAFGYVLAATLLGKILGLTIAELRLSASVRRLKALLETS